MALFNLLHYFRFDFIENSDRVNPVVGAQAAMEWHAASNAPFWYLPLKLSEARSAQAGIEQKKADSVSDIGPL